MVYVIPEVATWPWGSRLLGQGSSWYSLTLAEAGQPRPLRTALLILCVSPWLEPGVPHCPGLDFCYSQLACSPPLRAWALGPSPSKGDGPLGLQEWNPRTQPPSFTGMVSGPGPAWKQVITLAVSWWGTQPHGCSSAQLWSRTRTSTPLRPCMLLHHIEFPTQ